MKITRYVLKYPPEQMARFKNWCQPESCYIDRDSSAESIFPSSFWEAMVFESYEKAATFRNTTGNEQLIIAKQTLTLSDEVKP